MGIATVAYASLGCGQLLQHPVVTEIAEQTGKAPAQVCGSVRMALGDATSDWMMVRSLWQQRCCGGNWGSACPGE